MMSAEIELFLVSTNHIKFVPHIPFPLNRDTHTILIA